MKCLGILLNIKFCTHSIKLQHDFRSVNYIIDTTVYNKHKLNVDDDNTTLCETTIILLKFKIKLWQLLLAITICESPTWIKKKKYLFKTSSIYDFIGQHLCFICLNTKLVNFDCIRIVIDFRCINYFIYFASYKK